MAVKPSVKPGVIAYGVGERSFHPPFIEAAEGIETAGVGRRPHPRRPGRVPASVRSGGEA